MRVCLDSGSVFSATRTMRPLTGFCYASVNKHIRFHVSCTGLRIKPRHAVRCLGSNPGVIRDSDSNGSSWALEQESIDKDTAELMQKYKSMFQAVDKDGDGKLQRNDLRLLLERVNSGFSPVPLHWLLDSDLDQIFELYDINRDGFISFDEFLKLAHDNVFLTKELTDYQAAFAAVDTGGDGLIGPTELMSVLVTLNSPLQSYENITKIMEKYDKDHSGRIDFGEFLRMCRYERALPLDDILTYAATKSGIHPSNSNNNMNSNNNNDDGAYTRDISMSSSSSDSNDGSMAQSSPATHPDRILSVVSERQFQGILECNKDALVVVMGSLSWCRPCKRFSVVYKRFAAAYPDVVFCKLTGNDSDETKTLFKEKLKIRATPAFLLFRNGELVGTVTGNYPERFETQLRGAMKEGESMPQKRVCDLVAKQQ